MAYDVFGDTNGYPGSSFRYGENANTHFDFAAAQSGFFDPIANNTASGLVIRAFNGISGNLTGALASIIAEAGIFATPTLLFLSPEGEMLAPALVGFNGARNYGDLVARRMNRAHANLASGERPSRSMLADSE